MFWGHGLKSISSVYVEANAAAFIVESKKKKNYFVICNEFFRRSILDDELTYPNEEAVGFGFFHTDTARSAFKS